MTTRRTEVCPAIYYTLIICAICVECRTLQKEYTAENDTTNETNTTTTTVSGPICVTSDGIKLGQNDIIFSSPGQCLGLECDKNGELVYLRCKPAKIKRGCHGRYFDLTKPFPECCPAAVC